MDKENGVELELKVGDIIEIESPNDLNMNKKIFLIKYIDKERVDIVSEDDLVSSIDIKDGTILSSTIFNIRILAHPPQEEGYAIQNGFIPGTWINIFFSEKLQSITGKIIDLEADMITINTQDNRIIYINFDYSGIPKNTNISKIVIIENPNNEVYEEKEILSLSNLHDDTEEKEISEFHHSKHTENEIDDIIDSVLYEGNNVKIGQEDSYYHQVEIPEEERKYSLDSQIDDLMSDLLAKIPVEKQTYRVMNKIHTILERYKQLRNEYSKVNRDGSFSMIDKNGDNHKPLVKSLEQLDTKLAWIIPVVNNNKKIEKNDDESLVDESILDFTKYDDDNNVVENKYYEYIKELTEFYRPFINENDMLDKHHNQYINKSTSNINALINNNNKIQQTYINGDIDYSNDSHKITEGDKIYIKSFITLPKSVIQYSNINLPSSGLFQKSNLNMTSLSYSRIFK